MPGAPKDRLDPQDEFVDAEWFCEVVVAAGHEPADPIVVLVPRREEQNRRETIALTEPSADLDAVDAGKHDVEHDQVVPLGRRGLETLQSSADMGHRVAAVTQRRAHHIGDRLVVFDDQESATSGPLHLISQAPEPVRNL